MGTRRTHSLEFKQGAVEASDQPGASIAGVAMAHGINANQLHKWRHQLLATKAGVTQPQILPVTITPEAASMPDAPSAQEGTPGSPNGPRNQAGSPWLAGLFTHRRFA